MVDSLEGFFAPTRVAVIGASGTPKKPGNDVIRNILANEIDLDRQLPVAPINECDDPDMGGSAKVHQGIHPGAYRPAGTHDVFNEHDDPVVDR